MQRSIWDELRKWALFLLALGAIVTGGARVIERNTAAIKSLEAGVSRLESKFDMVTEHEVRLNEHDRRLDRLEEED